jgi:tripeptidyl-peptidase-1
MEAVNDLVKPADETLDLVHEWLFRNGVDLLDYSPAKDWINIYVDVQSAERLMNTQYSVFEHEDGSHLVRTTQWSLPEHLHDLIDTIQPTTSFMRPKGQKTDIIGFKANYVPPNYNPPTNEALARVCNVSSVTLQCFNTLYGTKGYQQKVVPANKNRIAFNNYLNQTPVRPDIYKFLNKYNNPAAQSAYAFKSIQIAGGPPALTQPLTAVQANQGAYEEANLDSQTILGMTYPMPVYSYSTGGAPPFIADVKTPTNTNEPYLTWVQYISSQKDIPQVISSSYGDDEQTVPKAYAMRVCQQFAQLGARGISLLVSSGDDGLGGSNSDTCVTNDGKKNHVFLPAFPAGCPYVTTVGATMEFEPELPAYATPASVSSSFFYASGSGFSNYFPRPSYQNGVVDIYVKNLPDGLYKGLYNPSMPLFPMPCRISDIFRWSRLS